MEFSAHFPRWFQILHSPETRQQSLPIVGLYSPPWVPGGAVTLTALTKRAAEVRSCAFQGEAAT